MLLDVLSSPAGDTITKTFATDSSPPTGHHPVQRSRYLRGIFSNILSMSVCATSEHIYFCLEVHAFNIIHVQSHQPVFSHVGSYVLLAQQCFFYRNPYKSSGEVQRSASVSLAVKSKAKAQKSFVNIFHPLCFQTHSVSFNSLLTDCFKYLKTLQKKKRELTPIFQRVLE